MLQTDNKSSTIAEPVFDPMTKIQLLENELAEALEANDMYKSQLKRLVISSFLIPSVLVQLPYFMPSAILHPWHIVTASRLLFAILFFFFKNF